MKRSIIITLLLLIMSSNAVYAHTSLTNSSPMDGEEIKEEVHEIELEFNTKIETTSTVKVFDGNEEEVTLNTQVNDNVITGGFVSPLDNGTYTVEWKVIGADGHPIQGTYFFTVNQNEIDDTAVPEETDETPAEPKEESLEKPVKKAIEDSSKIASNDVLVVFLVTLFTIAGGFIGWFIGRRKSR